MHGFPTKVTKFCRELVLRASAAIYRDLTMTLGLDAAGLGGQPGVALK